MNASTQFCPNEACKARGQVGQSNIVVHGRKRPGYKCKTCGRTFSARGGTSFAGLRKPLDLIVIVVTLLAYGCPLQAIVHAFGLDERTVADWRDRAGRPCEQVHQALIEQGKLDLVHVQADEIRIKARGTIAWMGLAMMVSTRLWVAGVVSQTRDKGLADHLLQQVRRCSQKLGELLICTDGWSAYPNSIARAFRKTRQTHSRKRKMRLRSVAKLTYRDDHQTHDQQASQRSGSSHDAREFGTSTEAASSFTRRNDAQYVLY